MTSLRQLTEAEWQAMSPEDRQRKMELDGRLLSLTHDYVETESGELVLKSPSQPPTE